MQPALQLKSTQENLVARITDAAYGVILRQGLQRSFVDIELELWQKIREVFRTREYAEALAPYEEALRLDPENVDAYVALAWLLATHPDERLRDGRRAVRLARKALEMEPAHPTLPETLAAAHAEAGDFEEAVSWRTKSLSEPPDLMHARPSFATVARRAAPDAIGVTS